LLAEEAGNNFCRNLFREYRHCANLMGSGSCRPKTCKAPRSMLAFRVCGVFAPSPCIASITLTQAHHAHAVNAGMLWDASSICMRSIAVGRDGLAIVPHAFRGLQKEHPAAYQWLIGTAGCDKQAVADQLRPVDDGPVRRVELL